MGAATKDRKQIISDNVIGALNCDKEYVPCTELRLDSGNRMAAGCEGNSPDAIPPSACWMLDADIVELVDVRWL